MQDADWTNGESRNKRSIRATFPVRALRSAERLTQTNLDSGIRSPGEDHLPAAGPFGASQDFANAQCVGQARKQLIAVTCWTIRADRNGKLAQRMIDPFKEDR